MSIYITGDTHIPIDVHKLSGRVFREQRNLTKDDYVLVCGDFGGVWDGSKHDKYWLDWLQRKNFTTLYCYGNHCNFPLTETYPVEEWNGGKIHKIRDSVFHLMNGEVFELEGKKFFIMGGATSHDKEWRIPGVSWWAEEIPSRETTEYGLDNLEKVGNKVDYIITHCAPTNIQQKIDPYFKPDILTDYLEYVYDIVEFDKWFCGHYHIDKWINEKFRVLYQEIMVV